jgi:hypothetical protein
MKIKILEAPGGISGAADRISFLLRKRTKHNGIERNLEIPGLTYRDLAELRRSGYRILIPTFNNPNNRRWVEPTMMF